MGFQFTLIVIIKLNPIGVFAFSFGLHSFHQLANDQAKGMFVA